MHQQIREINLRQSQIFDLRSRISDDEADEEHMINKGAVLHSVGRLLYYDQELQFYYYMRELVRLRSRAGRGNAANDYINMPVVK